MLYFPTLISIKVLIISILLLTIAANSNKVVSFFAGKIFFWNLKFFNDFLQKFLSKIYNSLEWCLNSIKEFDAATVNFGNNGTGDSGTVADAPSPWGLYFQDSASPQMEAIVELHNNIMFYLFVILLSVGWIMISIIKNYVNTKSAISNKYLNHGTLIELIWTITPALIIILIVFPSFKLLYLMDEVTDPSLTIGINGHQWYWSYKYPEFSNSYGENIEFDWYSVPDLDLIFNILFSDSQSESGDGSSDAGNSDVSSNAVPSNSGDPDNPDDSNNPNGSDNGSQDGSEVQTCNHGHEGYCQLCHDATHMNRVIPCRHDWLDFDHQGDQRYLGAKCDFSPDTNPHTLDPEQQGKDAKAYYCMQGCHANSCADCVDLTHGSSYSESDSDPEQGGGSENGTTT